MTKKSKKNKRCLCCKRVLRDKNRIYCDKDCRDKYYKKKKKKKNKLRSVEGKCSFCRNRAIGIFRGKLVCGRHWKEQKFK